MIVAQQQENDLTGVAGWAAGVIETLGAVGVGLLILLENLFPPLPSELILPLSGFAASEGRVNVVAVAVAATAGSVAGALLLYGLGAWLGHERAYRLADRIPFVDPADLDRATGWFRKHGGATVLFGRLVPVVRSFVSIPAGIERMPLTRFILYTTLGSAVWNTAFVALGYLLGSRWEEAGTYVGYATWAVLALAVLWIAKFLLGRARHRNFP
ncbi:DedA family protein [Actinocorallia longicatena]|uniref:VTT domain-containing protein n=1 Tax=Actinocorallia longicatena TaxID=111803 RepID=A0ABP6PZB5_9ACTN